MSEKSTIYAKIMEFRKNMPIITKNEKNPFFKSAYASLDAIQKAIHKPLTDAGLGYFQAPTAEGLETTIFDVDGNEIVFKYPVKFTTVATGKVETKNKDRYGNIVYSNEIILNDKKEPVILDLDSQGIGSAITYAKRYALTSCLGLIIEGEDDDGNQASGHNKNQKPAQEPIQQKIMTKTDFEQICKMMSSTDEKEKKKGFAIYQAYKNKIVQNNVQYIMHDEFADQFKELF